MINIFVRENIKELGLEAGDILFQRDNNMYEKYREQSLKKEGLEYSIKDSTKFSIDYLQEYLDEGMMVKYDDGTSFNTLVEDYEDNFDVMLFFDDFWKSTL